MPRRTYGFAPKFWWFSGFSGMRLPRLWAVQGELRDAICLGWAWDMIKETKNLKNSFSMDFFMNKIEIRKFSGKNRRKISIFQLIFSDFEKMSNFFEILKNFQLYFSQKNALSFFLEWIFGQGFFLTDALCDFLSIEHVFEWIPPFRKSVGRYLLGGRLASVPPLVEISDGAL